MSISRVKRGDVLTAAKVNELIDNANTQQGGHVEQEPVLTAEVSMKNIGQTKIYAGNPIVVTGSRVTGTLATRIDRFRKFGFQLSGQTNTITKTSSLAVAVEDISPGAIGRAVIPGLFAAYVYYKNDTDMQMKYCDVDNSGNFVYNQTEGEGAFEIVAPNGYETLAAGGSYYARNFAYIRSRGGGGGGGGGSYPTGQAVTDVSSQYANVYKSHSWSGTPISSVTISSDWSLDPINSDTTKAVVTDVSIDANGDIHLTKKALSITNTPSYGEATLSFGYESVVNSVSQTKSDFLKPSN